MIPISAHKGNATKTTLRCHLTPIRIASIKNTTTTNVGEDVGENEPSYAPSGNVS
jgi:hypothetical protein